MFKQLSQSDISKLNDKDFDNVVQFIDKFSESVMIQDDQERQDKLCKLIQKVSKNIEAQKAKKISEVKKQKSKAKRRKIVQKQCPDLPNEIWLKILNFLNSKDIFTNFALVSKHFHNLTLDSSAVKVLQLVKIKTDEKYQKAMKVLKRSKRLHGVRIECPQLYSNNFIIQAFKSNPNLKSLDIFEQEYNDPRWIKLQKETIKVFGKDLTKLNLEGLDNIDKYKELIKAILEQENLTHLEICIGGSSTVKDFLTILPQKCKKLEYIHFRNFWQCSSSIDKFFEDMKDNLKGISFGMVDRSRIDRILENIGLCQKLEQLKIFDASYLTDKSFGTISKLPNLKKISLHQLFHMPAEYLNEFFLKMNMTNLEEICIQGSKFVTYKHLEVLASRMPPKVHRISFTRCYNLKVPESTLKALMKCPSLKTLGFEREYIKRIPKETLLEFNKTVNISIYECIYPGWKWFTLTQYYNGDYLRNVC